MPQPAALWPSARNVLRQRLTSFSSEYYQILTATHLPTKQQTQPACLLASNSLKTQVTLCQSN